MGSFEARIKFVHEPGCFQRGAIKLENLRVVRGFYLEAANNNRDNERKILFESFVRSRRIIITNFRTIIFFKLNEYLSTNITLN